MEYTFRKKNKLPKKNRVLFLDRDGIINKDFGYVHKIEDFQFNSGIFSLLNLFRLYKFKFIIITNQSGIGRGIYSHESFHKLTSWMLKEFNKKQIHIEKVYHCPHIPSQKCHCRKPDTGMIEKAQKDFSIDMERSWLIGDKQSDIDCANNALVPNSIAINTKKIEGCTYSFGSIGECDLYFQEKKDMILR